MAHEGARYPHRCRLTSISGVIPVPGWERGTVVFPKLCARSDISSSVWSCSDPWIADCPPKEDDLDLMQCSTRPYRFPYRSISRTATPFLDNAAEKYLIRYLESQTLRSAICGSKLRREIVQL